MQTAVRAWTIEAFRPVHAWNTSPLALNIVAHLSGIGPSSSCWAQFEGPHFYSSAPPPGGCRPPDPPRPRHLRHPAPRYLRPTPIHRSIDRSIERRSSRGALGAEPPKKSRRGRQPPGSRRVWGAAAPRKIKRGVRGAAAPRIAGGSGGSSHPGECATGRSQFCDRRSQICDRRSQFCDGPSQICGGRSQICDRSIANLRRPVANLRPAAANLRRAAANLRRAALVVFCFGS